ncbi:MULTISPECIES: hypothetical protein [Sorangium]|uniref:Cytochrome P460 domain-containing protein n=1 Tax=Sorangium cellulosum TaxID=56 RepID=A0A4V0NG88_SORCE|nr:MULTISPECIES: hypothetical protein [Sorangium]AUX32322.1 uncharacterized protein SOCE836_044590 [Sorangium cellulosum]WCQ91696.1 hypothetical protein NQZ70_04419 [Sorangium sp. Soce836]
MRVAWFLLVLVPACSHPIDEAISPDAESAKSPPSGSSPSSPAAAPSAAPPAAAAEVDARFTPLIASAFRDYKAWGRVDDELRWAPWLCRLPLPGRARMSAAEDGGHARKLYSTFAKHRDRYPLVQGEAPMSQPVGQALVKESYHPELVDEKEVPEFPSHQPSAPDGASGTPDHFDPYVRDGDRVYRASRFAGAYVMLKVAPETPGTDAGWVYGTVTPEGEVTSAGRVASCMGCHESARHERVFGIATAPQP